MTKWIFAVINTICLIVLVLLSSIEIPTFSYGFYAYEYNKNGTYEQIGISEYDLKTVTHKLLDYMKDKEEDLVVSANISGVNREFFNSLEKAHMVDVKNMFIIGYEVRNIVLIVFIITVLCGFMYKRRPVLKEYAQALRIGLVGFIGVTGVLGAIIISNFDFYFTNFHLLFFDNDMWILNPEKDLLINIVPFEFFVDIFTFVVILFCVISFIFILLSTAYLKYTKTQLGAGKQ